MAKTSQCLACEMNTPYDLLAECAVKERFYWQDQNEAASLEIWDRLVEKDPVNAAIAATTEEKEAEKSKRHIELLRASVGRGVLLDLGCGYGRLAKYLLPVTHNVECYIGLDGALQMLELCHRFYRHNAVPMILIKSPIDRILLKDNSVDNVVSCGVFLHNDKDVTLRAIKEVYRVLKPGGRFFVIDSFPNSRSVAALQGRAYLSLLRWRGSGQRNGPVRYFSQAEVAALFGDFARITMEGDGFQVLPKQVLILPSFLNRLYRTIVWKPTEWLAYKLLPCQPKYLFSTYWQVQADK